MIETNNKSIIYLNNAATSWPKPSIVHEKVTASLQYPYQEHGRTTERNLIDYPKKTRMKLCEFFHGTDPKQFIFTANATDSLNLLIHGFTQHEKKPFHVITSDLEHNSVLRPLQTLQKKENITLSISSCNDSGSVSYTHLRAHET